MQAVSLFVFVLLYGYFGCNIVLFKVFQFIQAEDFIEFLLVLSPVYFIGSIVLFIRSIKKFNRQKYESLQ